MSTAVTSIYLSLGLCFNQAYLKSGEMMNPVLTMVESATRLRKMAFTRKLHQMTAIQEKFLQSLVRHHQETELGHELNLANITNTDQFRSQVPPSSYRQYEHYFERVAAGETNVITPESIIHINFSSGSTGKQKLVPITLRSHQKRNQANQIAFGFVLAAARRQNLSLGKMLFTASAKPKGYTSGGIIYGHTSSNHQRSSRNWITQSINVQPFEALLVADTLARHYISLLFALRNPNLRIMSGLFPLNLLQLGVYLEAHGESLIEDLARGEIAEWLVIEPEQRKKLQRMLAASPKRAKQLQHLLKADGRLLPKTVWPQLELLITARGGPSNFYFEKFPEYFGNCPIFGGTYAAAEAVLGIHRDFDTDGTILAIETNFVEFIPSDQWDATTPNTLLPHEVEIGGFYQLLITNYSGFYRYNIGDVVEVVGFYEAVPLIVFRYRQGGTLSAITEKTTEYHVMQVMAALQEAHSLTVEGFCITVSDDLIAPHYILNIELPVDESLTEPEQFLKQFDQLLHDANANYGEQRDRHDIAPPQLNFLKPGSFATLRQRKLKQGANDASIAKLSHISSDRTLLNDVEIIQQLTYS